jgi:hypothetical protein
MRIATFAADQLRKRLEMKPQPVAKTQASHHKAQSLEVELGAKEMMR